ncbi:MAG: glycosyltransferase [Candidatus Dojkabacteria bacterium]
MKKKILQVITDAGSCHKMAANSLTIEFEKVFPGKYDVKTIDLFKVADIEPFNNSDKSYALVSGNRALASVHNALFWLTMQTVVGYEFFSKYTVGMLLEECVDIIKNEKPDIVICNHPVVAIIAKAAKERLKNFKLVEVVVDPMIVPMGWADTAADLIICPTGEAVNSLVKYGVDISKIVYPLFPINPNLAKLTDKAQVVKDLNLDTTRPTVLLTGGGVGTKALKRAINYIVEADKYNLIVLAGKIEYFKEQLDRQFGDNKHVKILGYINNIQDMYNISDVIIAKPSAATLMETELFEKKVVWTKNIDRLDKGNIEYALRNPLCRYIGDDWDKVVEALDELIALNPREPVQGFIRSFDESEKIVKEIDKLLK